MAKNSPVSGNNRVDIAVLCHNAQTLAALIEPVQRILGAVDRFRKWESPIICITSMLITTLICILLPSFYILLANLTLLACVAGIGIAHLKGNILQKVLPRPVVTDNYNSYLNDLPEVEQHTDMMVQFKLMFYTICSLVLVLFHTFPLRWTVTLFTNGVIVYYPLKKFITERYFKDLVIKKEKQAPDNLGNLSQSDVDTISIAQVSVITDEEDVEEDAYSENSSTEFSDAEGTEFGSIPDSAFLEKQDKSVKQQIRSNNTNSIPGNEDDDLDQSCELGNSGEIEAQNFDIVKRCEVKSGSEGTESTGSDTGSIESSRQLGSSPNRPTGVVGRIMEFKRKQQQANTGTCVGCRANFTTILKRKRNCNYCGNSFCSKCCSFKVPKSTLGATAPGTQTEQVVVCQYCYDYLTVTDKEMSVDLKPRT